ncbi:MAG TPA: hypothetical protein PL190_02895 [Caldisericia bacterium]|nr:MAG: hypothetical protein BWX90_01114 [bacterium ADurb.Bin132]HNW32020.1 hypothetical protein [Caldisericia bacterium]HNY61100.1 hypothetical protein [Caldisericia bacterium]HOC79582.1 hypothetical protein [Caldisericia bacterium]HOG70110.1 hypothetical protein [Caldisericia bacterium]
MRKRFFSVLAIILLATFVFSPLAFAEVEKEPQETAGNLAKISQTVMLEPSFDHKGDLYVITSICTLRGKIEGNVFVMAQSVRMEDMEVKGSLFIAAANIYIARSKISGQGYLMCDTLEEDSVFSGDLKAAGGSGAILKGQYRGLDVMFGGEHGVVFSGSTERANIGGTKVEITEGAKVNGELMVFVPKNVSPIIPKDLAEKAQIKPFTTDDKKNPWSPVMGQFLSMIVAFLMGIFLLRFWRPWTERAITKMKTVFHWSFLSGLASFFVVLMTMIVLTAFLGFSGFVLGLSSFGVLAIFLYLGVLFSCYWLGKFIWSFGKQTNTYIVYGTGVFMFFALSFLIGMIPGIGWIAWLAKTVFSVAGCGAIIMMMFDRQPQ